jgi:RNA polymerase sigma-70 factor (family 1)
LHIMMDSYTAYTDIELVGLLKQDDRQAFTEIYNRYKGILFIHAYKRLKDQLEAEDAVHDLFARLWLNREQLSLHTGNFSGYLYATIRNHVLTTISRKGYADKYLTGHRQALSLQNAETDYKVRESQLKEIIEKHVALLPKKMRLVFELSRNSQLSHKEIAAQLGISEKTVKSQINSALNILRSKIGLAAFVWLLIHK